jgi:SPP1 family predicted phage head-tail adaptor
MKSEFAGILRERIIIQKPVDLADGYGGSVRSWHQSESVWAHVRVLNTTERLVAGRTLYPEKYEIICRSGVQVETGWRVAWRGRLMSILSVQQDPATPDRIELSTLMEREQ